MTSISWNAKLRPAAAVALSGATLALAGCGGGGTTTIIRQAPTGGSTAVTSASTSTTTSPPTTADCGQISFSGTRTTIVVLRGVPCSEAVRVATAFSASGPPSPWVCALAHAPLDSYPLPDGSPGVIGFSCGQGGSGGDLRAAPQALIGVAPAPGGSAGTTTSTTSAGPTASEAAATARRAASDQVAKYGINYAPAQFKANCSSSGSASLTWSCTVDSGQCRGQVTVQFASTDDRVGQAVSRRVGCGE